MILASGSVRDPGSSPGQSYKPCLQSGDRHVCVHTATVMDRRTEVHRNTHLSIHALFVFECPRNNLMLIEK